MAKLGPGDLDAIADRMRKVMSLREGAGRAKVTVHMGTCGISAGARKIMSAVMDCLAGTDKSDIIVTTSGCAGLCSREPMVTVELKDETPIKYVDLTPEKICRILEEHVIGKKIVEEYAFVKGSEKLS